ncbi:hypothetical protein [Tateyamaria sp. SN3-11]|uniref:hypothetical protein n=1 Tax=Tateyamaria sp. SN3-11 TaxID=3092147 RepID=UPI0039E93A48
MYLYRAPVIATMQQNSFTVNFLKNSTNIMVLPRCGEAASLQIATMQRDSQLPDTPKPDQIF